MKSGHDGRGHGVARPRGRRARSAVNLVALAPLTENMPSGSAYKPGDIVTFRNGKTGRDRHTDAEGRVVLADALDFAKESRPPSSSTTPRSRARPWWPSAWRRPSSSPTTRISPPPWSPPGSGPTSGSGVSPLWDDYKENIRSDWADFKNTGGRYGGSHQRSDLPEGVRRPEDPVGPRGRRSDGLLRTRGRRAMRPARRRSASR